MARKKPPGTKRKGPTVRARNGRVDDFLRGLGESQLICECDADSSFEVLHFLQNFIDRTTWDPPLPDDFSLLVSGSSWNEHREMVLIRGVDDLVAWGLKKEIEDHPSYSEWGCATE